MATGNNDFLPIAIAGGAPVLTQAAWVSAVPANGRGAGIVPKEYYNKQARQASSIAAMIGKFISDAGFNANDDGNIAALELAFQSALGNASVLAPTSYSMRDAAGAARSRVLTLQPGTWELALYTAIGFNDLGSTYDITATQAASIGTTNISTSTRLFRSGGAGYGRSMFKSSLAVGNLVVATTASFTMSMAAVTLAGLVSFGSTLTLEKIA